MLFALPSSEARPPLWFMRQARRWLAGAALVEVDRQRRSRSLVGRMELVQRAHRQRGRPGSSAGSGAAFRWCPRPRVSSRQAAGE
ncbi:hypothetical protein SAMN02799642_02906 [Methylobacterium brachiatum]|nr:hypothetical protein SAMN02799642_02906 [Methylobacterium brachiatum]